ncbi:hypothetical protein FE784_25885 [Paenibacillus hemerocallicola]|uniref:Sporulation protein n=1 Tax=Paenibacillus hemerocallicola TaxID=1172614 RepID=A0A5C4T2V6_9BACL|nr:hypothetical protein [Paenibacillus hemerocallicola]TNJ63353.1 hypothetical protein FE784_25885 [Paenibacillus hemerocallicola]
MRQGFLALGLITVTAVLVAGCSAAGFHSDNAQDAKKLTKGFQRGPTYPERPGVGLQVDAHILSVTSASKHKQEAFQVLATVVSDEVQLDIAKKGKISALNDPKIQKAFGENLTFVNGKNLQAAFKTKPAETFVATEYINDAKTEIRAAFKEVTEKGKDINTALREAEEKTNLKIQQKEAAKVVK